MIRHIVFFSVKPDQDIDVVRKGLEQLGTIPYSDVFEVLPNSKVDPMGNAIDLVVYAEFKDEEALFAYKTIRLMTHPRSMCVLCVSCASPLMS